jgi:aspartate-semialdehyde dehydrogenase
MSPRRAEFAGTARLAVVGAETPSGSRLRAVLARSGFPGARLDLYGEATGSELVLSEYAGEARVIQAADPAEIALHAVVFLCEKGAAARRLVREAPASVVLVDLVGAAAGERGAARVLVVPSALALLLADLLRPLQAAFGVREACAVVLRPAADFGQAGLDELRDQTVRLLSFADTPKEVFGRQLAFNVLPDTGAPAAEKLEEEVARLVGWESRRLTATLALVPVFYGHTLLLRVVPEERAGVAEAEEALRGVPGVRPPSPQTVDTPLDAAEAAGIDVAAVRDDPQGGLWVWAVAGDAEAATSEQALRMAAELADL